VKFPADIQFKIEIANATHFKAAFCCLDVGWKPDRKLRVERRHSGGDSQREHGQVGFDLSFMNSD
jgi:hypothetical protein